jgi:Fe-S-cluster containining protein
MDRLRAVYAQADAEAAKRNLSCRACGGCCRFATAGHRLLASAAELALLLEGSPPACRPEPGRCPYQQGARCTARERRPLGCRVYFCDEPSAAAAGRYERHHRQVRRLHAERGLPYAYAELTGALAELLPAAGAGVAKRRVSR